MRPTRRIESSHLTPDDLQALRRVSAAGAENAGHAISALTGLELRFSDPCVRAIQVDEVPGLLGGDEAPVVALHMPITAITGDSRGSILFALAPDCARRLLGAIFPGRAAGTSRDTDGVTSLPDLPAMPEMERSGLLETANILAAAYLNPVSDLTRLSFIPSVPNLAADMAGALVGYLLVEITQGRDAALLIDTTMHDEAGDLSARILLLPDPATLPRMLDALRLRGM